jgi:hypothetical protein
MTDRNFFQAFEKWWEASPDRLPTKRARDRARDAFLAGCRVATEPKLYRFQAGQWVVTVKAQTVGEARKEAIRTLDRRAEKIGADRPERGWQLSQVMP